MKHHYPILIEQDQDGIYVVECPLFKGCRSYGHSIEEAMINIREAIEVCLEEEETEERSTIFVGMRDLEIATP